MTLKSAAKEGVFTGTVVSAIMSLKELSSGDVNNFVSNPGSGCGPLYDIMKDKVDVENCIEIIECLIDRSAKLVAANMAAVILKTNKGKSAQRPILITIEGTTFYKMHKLRSVSYTHLRAHETRHD